jgi:hypothetical protein
MFLLASLIIAILGVTAPFRTATCGSHSSSRCVRAVADTNRDTVVVKRNARVVGVSHADSCYVPGTAGTPDIIIPGTPGTPGMPGIPGTPDSPGTPDIPGTPDTPPTVIPGTAPTPGMWVPCG